MNLSFRAARSTPPHFVRRSLRAGSDGEESPAGARRSPGPRRSRLLVQEQPRSSSAGRLSLGRGGFLALCGASNEPVIPSVSEESPGWVARTPSLVPPYRGSLAHARDDSLCERDRDLFIPVPTTRGAVPTLGMTPGGQREPPTENSDGA